MHGEKQRPGLIPGADLLDRHNPYLEGANVREAHLERAHLEEGHLEGVDLNFGKLKGADLVTT